MIKKKFFKEPTKLDYERIHKMKNDELIILRNNNIQLIKNSHKLQELVISEMRHRNMEFLNKGKDYYSYTIGFNGNYESIKRDFLNETCEWSELEEKLLDTLDEYGYEVTATYID